MFNWWKKKQERKQEGHEIVLLLLPRYKVVQHVVTGEWAILGTKKQKVLDLSTRAVHWCAPDNLDAWAYNKELVENVVKALS